MRLQEGEGEETRDTLCPTYPDLSLAFMTIIATKRVT